MKPIFTKHNEIIIFLWSEFYLPSFKLIKLFKMNEPEEKVLFEKVKTGDIKAYEILFHRYYGHLCFFATRIIHDEIAAEEIVQDFFVKLWEKRIQLSIE